MRWMVLMMVWVTATPLWAAALAAELADIQHRWAEIQYQLPEDEREKAFEKLASEAEQFVADYPNRAEPLIWQGIVLSTYAGARGGLGALGLVKDARKSLEAAIAIDDRALHGSAYTSLGSLYYQVPGWPLSFGDDKQAQQYLQKALAINPEGIDPNYFFGDFLLEQGEEARARIYLNKALNAQPRPGRGIADGGRRQEISDRLGKL
ncbi:MAG: tetratricopeptide repeat protein [Marinobacter sp.]|uniref:tetratricopeptide repeat protein n=1 Tax=Marinobacter sp. TaxID=50741 RepID=UPI00329923EB